MKNIIKKTYVKIFRLFTLFASITVELPASQATQSQAMQIDRPISQTTSSSQASQIVPTKNNTEKKKKAFDIQQLFAQIPDDMLESHCSSFFLDKSCPEFIAATNYVVRGDSYEKTPNEKYIFVSDADKKGGTIYATENMEPVNHLSFENEILPFLASPDNSCFFINHGEGEACKIFRVSTATGTCIGKPIKGFCPHISKNSRFLIVGVDSTHLQIYDLVTDQPIGNPIEAPYFDYYLNYEDHAITSDSRFLVIHKKSPLRHIQIYSLATGQEVKKITIHDFYPFKMSNDGQYLVVPTGDDRVQIYNFATNQLIGEPITDIDHEGQFEEALLTSFLISDNSKYLIVKTKTAGTKVYNLATGHLIEEPVDERDLEASEEPVKEDYKIHITRTKNHTYTIRLTPQEAYHQISTCSFEQLMFIYDLAKIEDNLTGKKILLTAEQEKLYTALCQTHPFIAKAIKQKYHLLTNREHETAQHSLQTYENNKNGYVAKFVAQCCNEAQRKNTLTDVEVEVLREKLRTAFLKKIADDGAASSKKKLSEYWLQKGRSFVDEVQLLSLRERFSSPSTHSTPLAQLQTRTPTKHAHICSQSSSQSNCGICGATMSSTSSATTTVPIVRAFVLGKRSQTSTQHPEREDEQEKKSRKEREPNSQNNKKA